MLACQESVTQRCHPGYAAPELVATRPNELRELGHHEAQGTGDVGLPTAG